MLTALLTDPARPFVAVLGGAKVSDKIGVIERFAARADAILIGGAMCFPFLKAAQGHSVGDSLCADEDVTLARGRWRAGAVGRARSVARAARRPRARRATSAPTRRRCRWTASTCPTG